MEAYRSGRNELDSKSSCPQGHVGSNPTASATNPLSLNGFKGFLFLRVARSEGANLRNGAHGAGLVVPNR